MRKLMIIAISLVVLSGVASAEEANKEKWAGIDEAVIEKYATACGGFVMGYYWHKVFIVGKPDGEGDD